MCRLDVMKSASSHINENAGKQTDWQHQSDAKTVGLGLGLMMSLLLGDEIGVMASQKSFCRFLNSGRSQEIVLELLSFILSNQVLREHFLAAGGYLCVFDLMSALLSVKEVFIKRIHSSSGEKAKLNVERETQLLPLPLSFFFLFFLLFRYLYFSFSFSFRLKKKNSIGLHFLSLPFPVLQHFFFICFSCLFPF